MQSLFYRRNRRAQNGYSLVAVSVFSVVVATWLMVTASIVIPTYQKGSELGYWSIVRSSAEAGLDYVVSQLDTAFKNGTISSYDDVSLDGTPHVSQVPASVVGSAALVTVSVNNVRAPSTASVWKSQLDDQLAGNIVSNTNCFRVISATSNYAGLSSTVRIVISPMLKLVTTAPTTTPFFSYALYSQNALSASGNMITDAYDSRNGAYGAGNNNSYLGDVGSNTSVSLSGNTRIGGNLIVASLPKGSTTATVATRSGNAIVENQIKANGMTSGFTATVGPTPGSSDNVRALEAGTPRSGDYTTPIDKSLSQNQVSLTVAPSSPDGSYNVGAVNISGNGKVIVRNGVAPVSSINVGANNTLYIPPGKYKASSFNISGNGQLQIESNVTTNTVVYLEGNSAGSTVVQISGNGMGNATNIPARFQIFTNSSKSVSLSGNADFKGVIYAPSAGVSISGNGAVYGSVVGKSITSSGNGNIHFDLALKDSTYASTNTIGYVPAGGSGSNYVVNGLTTVSWEEF